MTTTIYKPREISQIDAVIFRELIFSKRALAVFPKDPAKKIRFFEASSSNVIDKKISFSLQVGQQKVDLAIELKPGTPLFKRIEEVGGLESLPEEFRVALMTFASQEIIDALEQLFQLPVTIWDAAKDKEEINNRPLGEFAAGDAVPGASGASAVELCKSFKKELYFEVLDAQGRCEACASIILSISLLERVLAVAQKTPVITSHSLTGKLLQGEVFIGSTTVSCEDWNSLCPGDLIVIQEPSAVITGQAKCFIKKSAIISIVVKPDFLKPLIQPLENFFPADVESDQAAIEEQEEQKNNTSSSIPLELNFSAGVLSLTVEETLQLVKTKILEKPFQLLKPLKIFIQERVVGNGELVKVGGRYALVVTQLAAKQD